MYLISQLWSYLALAFLLGALLGYLLWRWCGRPSIESQHERQRKDLTSRLGLVEQERSKFTDAAKQAEAESAKLRAELSHFKSAASEASSKALLFQEADEKLKVELDSARNRASGLSGDAERHQREAAEIRKSLDAERAAAKAREDKLATELAAAKKLANETTEKHQADLKRAQEHAAAEAAKKHADELGKARSALPSELAAKHAEDLKKAHETAKKHEAKVHALMQADTGSKKEIEDAKVSHAAELKKAHEQAAKKHADELAKARSALTSELSAKHSEELKKTRDQATSELRTKREDELKHARDQALAEASAKHAAELKGAREAAAIEAAKRHSEELARIRAQADAAAHAHAEDLKIARNAASAAVSAAALKQTSAASHADSPAMPLSSSRSSTLSAPKGGKVDDLKLIWGVGPEIEKLLNTHGIYHFEKMAHWEAKDIAWFDALLPEFHGRAEREKWVEQAKKLAGGWRPERAIGDKPTNLLTAPREGHADDLKLIWGVGPKFEQVLNNAGIYHFSQIASWTDRELQWVDSQMGDFAGRALRDKWIEQCQKLASGWRPKSDVGEKPA